MTLLLHKGASLVGIDEIRNAIPPAPTSSHHPVAHATILDRTEAALRDAGLVVVDRKLSLTPDTNRFFAVLRMDRNLSCGRRETESSLLVGMRSSYDMTFAIGLCIGFRVFVCDNMAFNADRVLSRKHTRNAATELPHLLRGAVDDFILPSIGSLERQIETLTRLNLSSADYASLLIDLMRSDALKPSELPHVDSEWLRNDGPGGFFPDSSSSGWRFLNAVTEVHKSSRANPQVLASRTIRVNRKLHALALASADA